MTWYDEVTPPPGAKVAKSAREASGMLRRVSPGDVIVIDGGDEAEWKVDALMITPAAKGTAEAPILIRPLKRGLKLGRVRLEGSHVIFDGFELTSGLFCSGQHVRITNVTWDNAQYTKWLNGKAGAFDVEVDHCTFKNKLINEGDKKGQVMQLLSLADEKPQCWFLHHNLVLDIPPGGGNDHDSIQIRCHYDEDEEKSVAKSVVPIERGWRRNLNGSVIAYNHFIRNNGDVETISLKSSFITIYRNIFHENSGKVVLRGSNSVAIIGNSFNTTGLRMQGKQHLVASNHFQSRKGRALHIHMGGGGYGTCHNAIIRNNTFRNYEFAIAVMPSRGEGQKAPCNVMMRSNVFEDCRDPINLPENVTLDAAMTANFTTVPPCCHLRPGEEGGIQQGTTKMQLLEGSELSVPAEDSVCHHNAPGEVMGGHETMDLLGNMRPVDSCDAGAIMNTSGMAAPHPLLPLMVRDSPLIGAFTEPAGPRPMIHITSPTPGATVDADYTVTAQLGAIAPGAGLLYVELFVNGLPVGTRHGDQPLTWQLEDREIPHSLSQGGATVLRAMVLDTQLRCYMSPPLIYTVAKYTGPPALAHSPGQRLHIGPTTLPGGGAPVSNATGPPAVPYTTEPAAGGALAGGGAAAAHVTTAPAGGKPPGKPGKEKGCLGTAWWGFCQIWRFRGRVYKMKKNMRMAKKLCGMCK